MLKFYTVKQEWEHDRVGEISEYKRKSVIINKGKESDT